MRRRRGFTLLEAVVALAVTAVVLIVLQRATGDAARARTGLAHQIEERGALRAGLVHLVREVGLAQAGTLRLERAATTGSPVLTFAVETPEPAVVRYRLVEGGLERTEQPRFALAPPAAPGTLLLAGVHGLETRVRDGDGWHETWDAPRAPTLLALEFELASGERFGTTVPLAAGVRP
jgi:prepilin-type N-terminal cleavage/methylation domain-containing protein